MDFDKAFYDSHETDSKILKRFIHAENDLDDKECRMSISKRQIVIEAPINCLLLQENIT